MQVKSKTTKGLDYRDARDYRRGYTNGLSKGFVNETKQRLARKKEEEKYGKILAIFLLGMLLLSVGAVLAWQSGKCDVNQNSNEIRRDGNFWKSVKMEMTPRGTAHVPISIDGNADFANQAAIENWTGNGTEGNPYIIEGYDIDGNGGSYAIWIENTDVYFEIRNCHVFNATKYPTYPYGSGIALTNVEHGTITNNSASGNCFGILLNSSRYNSITNNNVSGNSYDGIHLGYSSNNAITNNNASGNSEAGIYLRYSNSNNIENNNASGNDGSIEGYGISLIYSDNNTISNNSAIENSGEDLALFGMGYGIYLASSNNNTITNNNASDNHGASSWDNGYGYGIYLSGSRNNTITDNNMCGNWGAGAYGYGYGLYVVYSGNNTIANNNASGNYGYGDYYRSYGYGISLVSSNNNSITNNNASSNYGANYGEGYGIHLYNSSCNTITYNWFCNNKNYGANLTAGSTANTIHHNIFIANNGASRGAIGGISQAYDDVGGNTWYDNTAKEGNYWSNWDGNGWGTANAYPIAGSAGASDYYPWGGPTSEFSAMPIGLLVVCLLFVIVVVQRRK